MDAFAGWNDGLRHRRWRLPRPDRHSAAEWLCAAISIPIGVFAGIFWSNTEEESSGKATTFMVDILTGVPSIVAALFIYALWVATLGFPDPVSRCRWLWCC